VVFSIPAKNCTRSLLQHSTVQYSTAQYSTVQYSRQVQYSTVMQYSQESKVQYFTVIY